MNFTASHMELWKDIVWNAMGHDEAHVLSPHIVVEGCE